MSQRPLAFECVPLAYDGLGLRVRAFTMVEVPTTLSLETPHHSRHSVLHADWPENERRTLIVASITAIVMVLEIVAGRVLGSMALYADGLHMASHTFALGISVVAYWYARRHEHNPRFSFGTGKVNTLAGYTGAILLGCMSLWMGWESLERTLHPTPIHYREALIVAGIGLMVNAVSALILRDRHCHGSCATHKHDHNLRSAYLHVVADAATSVLAIGALAAGMFWDAPRIDPVIGLAGAVLVGWWSIGLLRDSAGVLLDQQAPEHIEQGLRRAVQVGDDRIVALRCWAIAPARYAAIISLVSESPRTAEYYRARVAKDAPIVHLTIEVDTVLNECKSESAA